MHKRLFFVLLAAVMLIGCTSRTPTPDPGDAVEVFNPPPLYTATIPGVPSPDATPTRTLLLPESLSSAEVLQRLDPFHSPITPEGCVLPCYNGLRMGESIPNDVYDFYAHLGIGISDLIPGDFEAFRNVGTGRLGAWLTKTRDAASMQEQGITAPLVTILMQDNFADAVYVTWAAFPPYLSVPQILSELGEPGQIRVGVVFSEEPAAYLLELAYPDRQTSFVFYGDTLGDVSSRKVCVNADQTPTTIMSIAKPGAPLNDQLAYGQFLLPIADTLGMNYAEFASRMTDTGCIDVPNSIWANWTAITP